MRENRTYSLLLWLLALLVIASTVYVRIRLLNTPLERDEGEYAYMGQLLLKGIPPYTNAYTMKLPGVAVVYALFMSIFGQSASSIRIGLMLVNVACAALVYLLGKRLFTKEAAISAAAFYAMISLSQSVLGIFAHATHLVVFFSLAGILLLDQGVKSDRTWLRLVAGICFGLAILMKQHAALLIPFAFVAQIWPYRTGRTREFARQCTIFLAGVIAPYCAVVIWTVTTGSFGAFWFWTVQYARQYASTLSLSEGSNEFFSQAASIAKTSFPVWLLAGIGLILFCRGTRPRREKLFLVGYLATSFAMICTGFFFRPHYFILLLPPIALLAAHATTTIFTANRGEGMGWLRPFVPVLLLTVSTAYLLIAERDYAFILPPEQVSRMVYGASPFPEAVAIAEFIHSRTTAQDRIAILGSEPEILFYADRRSATGHIYMYGLMEEQKFAGKMQAQLIEEIEAAAPAFIVVVNSSSSWLLQQGSLNRVLDWGDRYLPLRYDEVGIVDIFDDKPSRYLWGKDTSGYVPESQSYVAIYKKRY